MKINFQIYVHPCITTNEWILWFSEKQYFKTNLGLLLIHFWYKIVFCENCSVHFLACSEKWLLLIVPYIRILFVLFPLRSSFLYVQIYLRKVMKNSKIKMDRKNFRPSPTWRREILTHSTISKRRYPRLQARDIVFQKERKSIICETFLASVLVLETITFSIREFKSLYTKALQFSFRRRRRHRRVFLLVSIIRRRATFTPFSRAEKLPYSVRT